MKMIRTARIACIRFGSRETVIIILAQMLSAYNLYRGWLAYLDPTHVIPTPICAAMVLMNGLTLLATVRWRQAGLAKRIVDADLVAENV
jgi:hypothetical protein